MKLDPVFVLKLTDNGPQLGPANDPELTPIATLVHELQLTFIQFEEQVSHRIELSGHSPGILRES